MTPEMSSEVKARFAKEMVGELKRRFETLGELVDKLADLAQQAVKDANVADIQSYDEGLAVGKQLVLGWEW